MIEEPRRRSKKLLVIGIAALTYSLLTLISLILTLLSVELGMKLLLVLVSTPWIVFGAALGFVALTAKLPKPAEEFQREYEETLREVKRKIEEWKKGNELGGV